MQIIILGAGQVGSSLAASLVVEQHSVTVIDSDAARLNALQAQYDLRTVCGHYSYPNSLAEAGADSANMIIAVTDNDEINIVACFVAATIFNIPIKIAHVRAADYFLNSGKFFAGEQTPVDVFINPATLAAENIAYLIEYPGALRVFDFAEGQVKLVATKPLTGGALVGQYAKELNQYLPNVAARIVAIYRENKEMPLKKTTIDIGDDILFLAEKNQVIPVLNTLRPAIAIQKSKCITIVGGGNIGTQLAQILENKYQVKLIEQDRGRCEQLSQELRNTLILHGDGCDSQLLRNESVENSDCFCALSNSDADNIVSSLQSKQLGAKQVIALVNRDAYLSLIISGYLDVDIALSPQQLSISAILRYLRNKQIVKTYSLRRGLAEALEVVVHPKSQIVGSTVAQLSLPADLQISLIMRQKTIIIPDSATRLQSEDHAILFVGNKAHVPAIEHLFSSRDKI